MNKLSVAKLPNRDRGMKFFPGSTNLVVAGFFSCLGSGSDRGLAEGSSFAESAPVTEAFEEG
jgi:hypothetical protein